MQYFEERNISAVKEPAIRWVGPNNEVAGYPDIIVKFPDSGLAVLEIKTGDNPDVTISQSIYLPMLALGLHLYSDNEAIGTLGLLPGEPFPPMKVYIVRWRGPTDPYFLLEVPPPKNAD